MDALHDRPKAAVGESTTKESSKGLAWWRPRRSNLADLSNTSSASTSIISTSSPPQRPHHHRHGLVEASPSSANRLLFDDPATEGERGAAGLPTRPFETQQKPPRADGKQQLWTRGSREGTAAPSPEEERDDHNDANTDTDKTATAGAPPLLLPAYSSSSSAARRRRPQGGDLLGSSSSGKLKSLKLAPPTGYSASSAATTDRSPGTPVTSVGSSDASEGTWTESLGRAKGRRFEQQQQQQQQRWRSEEHGGRRTPTTKPPRPGAAGKNEIGVDTNRSTAAPQHGDRAAAAAAAAETAVVAAAHGRTGAEAGAKARAGGGRSGGVGGEAVCSSTRERREAADGRRWEEGGMDDETAVRFFNAAAERSVVYDILAVDRGCGFCDTSIVPFPVEDGGQVAAGTMRDLTAGHSEFLARRGFAAGLVSHFLEETNCEFRVLQGGTSCGMTAHQLQEAAVRLEEAFVPAVKRLRERASMDVVLDSLFEGKDDAGEFVVRFEVSITRCHPEDIESSPTPALQECAGAIREAIREDGVPEQSTHEVVFVGRPMWELVSPVLDFSAKAAFSG